MPFLEAVSADLKSHQVRILAPSLTRSDSLGESLKCQFPFLVCKIGS